MKIGIQQQNGIGHGMDSILEQEIRQSRMTLAHKSSRTVVTVNRSGITFPISSTELAQNAINLLTFSFQIEFIAQATVCSYST